MPLSGYTREKIRNLNDHCNDDCNSSLECEFSRGTSLYINTCAHKYKGHVKLRLPKDVFDVFAYTRKIRTVI